MTGRLAACLIFLWAGAACALELSLPSGSRLISDRGSAFDSYYLPTGAWTDGAVPVMTVEGRVARQSWRVESAAITTLQILEPLRAQLTAAGYETVFECATRVCGGFDFRFAIEVIPAPDMYVDIRDFRFLAARSDTSVVSLLVSRSRTAGYVQIIEVGPPDRAALRTGAEGGAAPAAQSAAVDVPVAQPDLAGRLRETGSVILFDLEFASGTTNLADAPYASLRELAAFLKANPSARIAVVGHTDVVGDLTVNIAVSKRRAAAVRQRLIDAHGIAGNRIDAEGMGYLAPVASNLTSDGRDRNRRVEVILLSLD